MFKELGKEIAESFNWKKGIYAKAEGGTVTPTGIVGGLTTALTAHATAYAMTSIQDTRELKTGACAGGKVTEYVARPSQGPLSWAHLTNLPRKVEIGNHQIELQIRGDRIYFPEQTKPGEWNKVRASSSGLYVETKREAGGHYSHPIWQETPYTTIPLEEKSYCYERIGKPIYERDE
jgi:hypothetical protein